MTFLVWLNESGLAKWISGSPSVWAYPTILTTHTLGMAMLLGLASIIDLRILGLWRRLPLAVMEQLYPAMWLGFSLSALSGSGLFIADAVGKAENPAFWIKMVCVALATLSMWWLRRRVFHRPDGHTASPPTDARILAAASLALWIGAITAGRLIAYVVELQG